MPRSMCVTRSPARAFVVVAIVAVTVEPRIGHADSSGDATCLAHFVVVERAQEPAAAGVCSFHLERAVGFAWMADDFVRDQRIEMRVGNDDDFAVGRLEDGRGRELVRFGGEVDANFARDGFGINSPRHPSLKHSRPRCWPIVS